MGPELHFVSKVMLSGASVRSRSLNAKRQAHPESRDMAGAWFPRATAGGGLSCCLDGGLRENRAGESRPVRRALGSGTLISEAQGKDLSSYWTSGSRSAGPSEPVAPWKSGCGEETHPGSS